jgi:hypothetical protein
MHGGKREGAGRKKVNTYETTVIKVPLPLKELIKSIIEIKLNDYKQTGEFDLSNCYLNLEKIDNGNGNQVEAIKTLIEIYENQYNNSPRWAKAKQLIKELKAILDV